MKKRIIAALICFSMLLTGMSTAVFADTTYDRAPGEFEFYQDLSKVVYAENAMFDGEFINISPGGYAEYEFTLPFDAKTLDIAYKVPESATLTLEFPTNKYEVELEIGKYNTSVELAPEQLGDLKVTLSSEKRVLVSELKYTKIDAPCVSQGDTDYFGSVVKYTPFQEAIKSAVVIMEGSSAIKTRNLTRYINMDDTFEVPSYIDGSMYLPANAYAKAFGYYIEEYPEKNYVYMSGDNFSIYFTDNESYFEKNGSKSAINNLVKYVNGKAYLPVRAISEMLDFTVIYNDGVIIIDKKLAAEAISADRAVMTNLKKELTAYIPAAERNKTYHVSKAKNASNLNDGTEDAPFATIQMAANLAKAGDTVIIHEGVYRETVTVKNNGLASNPIIFKAADGENVTVSAFDEVTHFAPYENEQNGVKMYMSNIGGYKFENMLDGCWDVDRNVVIYNDEMLTEGRHPNKKTSVERTVERFNGTLNITDNPTQTEEFKLEAVPDLNTAYPDYANHKMLPVLGDMRVTDVVAKSLAGLKYDHKITSDIDLSEEKVDHWAGATFIGLVGKGLQPSAIQVISSKKGEAIASEVWKGEVGTVTDYQDKYANDYGYLTHHINTVDMPGEWYIDQNKKQFYIIPPEGVNTDDMVFEMKTRQIVFDLRNRKYVQIVGINTRGGGITMGGATGCLLNGGTHKYISQFDISAMYDMDSLDNIYKRINPITEEPVYKEQGGPSLTNCDLSGETGFALSGLYNAIVNTDIEYASGAGITVSGSYNYLENNKIDKTGYGSTSQSGIYVNGRHQVANQPIGGHQIYQNTSTAAGRGCFTSSKLVAAAPMDVAFNEFAYGMIMARDGGNVITEYTMGGTEYNPTAFHHNTIHDVLGAHNDTALALVYNGNDVGMCNINDNILYFSTKDSKHTGEYILSQGEGTEVDVDKWANTKAMFDSADKVNFTVADYPGAYPFKTGARSKADRDFMINFNKEKFAYVSMIDGSNTAQGINVANDSKLSLFYTSDKYLQDAENATKAIVEFYKNGQLVGTEEVELYAYAPGRELVSKVVIYPSAKYAGCDMVKLSSSNSTIKYVGVAVSDITFIEENEKPQVIEEEVVEGDLTEITE